MIKRYGTPQAGQLPYAQAAGAQGWLYVSGQCPVDENDDIVVGSITVQARLALKNLKAVLEGAGYTMNDVVRVGVWLEDPRDFPDFNEVYKEFFSTDHAPARVTVQAMLMSDMRVEIDCIAYKEPEK